MEGTGFEAWSGCGLSRLGRRPVGPLGRASLRPAGTRRRLGTPSSAATPATRLAPVGALVETGPQGVDDVGVGGTARQPAARRRPPRAPTRLGARRSATQSTASPSVPRQSSSCSLVSSRPTAIRRSRPAGLGQVGQGADAPGGAPRRAPWCNPGRPARRSRSGGARPLAGQEPFETEPLGRQPGRHQGGQRRRRPGTTSTATPARRPPRPRARRDRRCRACRRR